MLIYCIQRRTLNASLCSKLLIIASLICYLQVKSLLVWEKEKLELLLLQPWGEDSACGTVYPQQIQNCWTRQATSYLRTQTQEIHVTPFFP